MEGFCSHYDKDPETFNRICEWVVSSPKSDPCKLCPPVEDCVSTMKKKSKKGRHGVTKQTKGQPAVKGQTEVGNIWVCFSCGESYCVKGRITKNVHARVHAVDKNHWWSVEYNSPVVGYCFMCNKDFPIQIVFLDTPIKTSVNKVVADKTSINKVMGENASTSDEVVPRSLEKQPSQVHRPMSTVAAGQFDNSVMGMIDRGEICCFNSVLQVMLATRKLRKGISDAPKDGTLTIALKKLFDETTLQGAGNTLSTDDLYSRFTADQMMECDTFLSCFLGLLSAEEIEAYKPAENALCNGHSTIDSLFSGVLTTVVHNRAGCSHVDVKDAKFFVISLQVPPKSASKIMKLEDCFYLYTESEDLSDWTCQQCTAAVMGCSAERKEGDEIMIEEAKISRAATRKVQISKAPPILVVALKRLCPDSSMVIYKKELNIAPFMDQSRSLEKQSTNYTLTGVVSRSQGRFTAFVSYVKPRKVLTRVKHVTTWVSVADEVIRNSSPFLLISEKEPHLLLYQQNNPPELGTKNKEEKEKDCKTDDRGSKLDDKHESTLSLENAIKGQVNDPTELDTNNKEEKVEEKDCKTDDRGSKLDVTLPLENVIKGQVNDLPELGTNNKEEKDCKTDDSLDGKQETALSLENVIKGLPNLGNSCFFNSVLQNLLALDLLRHMIIRQDTWSGDFATELKKLCVETNVRNYEKCPLDPEKLFTMFCSKHVEFSDRYMQDSHEMLYYFLNDIEAEEIDKRQLATGAATFVYSIFGGMLSSTVQSIQCPHSSTAKEEKFYGIEMTIPSTSVGANHSDTAISIEDCLNEHYEAEGMSGWFCEQCPPGKKPEDSHRNAIKKDVISEAPPVLVIHLRRLDFSSTNIVTKKVDRHVTFREMLDIRPFMIMDKRNDVNVKTTYNLVGLVVYEGDIVKCKQDVGGGHYVSYVRGFDIGSNSKSWYKASDLNVRKSSLAEVLASKAYLLFYEKANVPLASTTDMQAQSPEYNKLYPCTEFSMNMQHQGLEHIEKANAAPATYSVDMQTRAPEDVGILPPWITYHKKRSDQGEARKDADLAHEILLFLHGFKLPGDNMPYYHSQMVSIVERGFGSRELDVLYSHLITYDEDFAMRVSNRYDRLRGRCLKETAENFMDQALKAIEPFLSDKAKKLLETKTSRILELTFHGMPRMHELLSERLKGPLHQAMTVYGHVGSVMIPLPDKLATVQGLIAHMRSNYRAGFSWNGNLELSHMHIFDGKVVIRKAPIFFGISHPVSIDMIKAIETDLLWVASNVLRKFKYAGSVVPFLDSFSSFLRHLDRYRKWWKEPATAESLWDLIEHNPFLKPSLARANFMSGVHTAIRSYDEFDAHIPFKKTIELIPPGKGLDRWSNIIRNVALDPSTNDVLNPVLHGVIEHKEKMVGSPGHYYTRKFSKLVEYLRHLSNHGTSYSMQKVSKYGPREQMMQSLEETELSGSIHLEYQIMKLFIRLGKRSMTGMIEAVWDCYKKCNHSL